MSAQVVIQAKWILERFDEDGQPILHRDSGILVDGTKVQRIGQISELTRAYPNAKTLGNQESVVIPGLINAHHHVGLTPFQLGSVDHPLELWFASRIGLRDVDLRLDTLYSAFEMISTGVTTVQHLHSRAPGGVLGLENASEQVIGAYRDIGMRVSYSMALRDQNRLVYEADEEFIKRVPRNIRPDLTEYLEGYVVPLKDQVDFFESLYRRHKDEDRICVQLAPANLHWLSDTALESAADAHNKFDVPLHMHLLETPYQKMYASKRTGNSALSYIEEYGLLGPQLTIGHGVWMNEAEIDLIAETGTNICHNCSSNLRLKSGIAPINCFVEKKVPVALGIDEAGINDDRDMLQEMRLVLQMHQTPGIGARSLTAPEVLRMATEFGARTTPFGKSIGQLSEGSEADLVLLNHQEMVYPYQNDEIPIIDVLVQRTKSKAVEIVMVAGEIVYNEGSFAKVDQGDVLAEIAERLAYPISKQEMRRHALARSVFPHVKKFYEDHYQISEVFSVVSNNHALKKVTRYDE
jgi:cytosine/adenosine deaminase-related metal-dependent hydrolase|tara:strand:+ start:234 stop:1799 length:1566 start_codon:yes stop_codon:yes gene_type:complete